MVGQQNCLEEPWKKARRAELLALAQIARDTYGEGFPEEKRLKHMALALGC
jgi:hypothetical protein